MAVGDIVTAERVNQLQTAIDQILGFGAGDFGYLQGFQKSTGNYGPALTSYQVSTDPADNRNVATANDINTLYVDILRARIHQVGVGGNEITDIIKNTRIIKDLNVIADGESFFVDNDGVQTIDPEGFAKGIADLEDLMTKIQEDRLICHYSQGVYETGMTSLRTDSWNESIRFVGKVVFDDFHHRRSFFNAGGEIRFQTELENPDGLKSGDWADLLASASVVKFNYNETITTVQGQGRLIGNDQLTYDYQTIFTKSSNGSFLSGVYAANMFSIQAKLNSDNIIEFRYLYDDVVASGTVDNAVAGSLTAELGIFRPKGTFAEAEDNIFNVEVPPPVYEIVTEISEDY